MKIVHISTISQHAPVGGRVFEAFCEYDPDLLAAHVIAYEMSEATGIPITELQYCITEKKSYLGAILSYNEKDLTDVKVHDRRLQSVGSDIAISSMSDPVEHHKFEEIDIKSYQRLILLGEKEYFSGKYNGDPF